MQINLIYDSVSQSAPASFKSWMQTAADILVAACQANITCNILVGYGEYNTVYATIVIIGVLATITIAYNTKIQRQTHDKEHATDVATIMGYAEKYYMKNGIYPYGATLNPTNAADTMPDYNAVTAAMPGIPTDSLTGSSGFNFFAFSCGGSCNLSSAQRAIKRKQFIYMTAPQGNNNYQYAIDKGDDFWGCKLTFNDSDPGAVIAWQSEDTGKWPFLKSAHGTVLIDIYSGGPTPPTTCTFTNA